jgi:hypothetical protein
MTGNKPPNDKAQPAESRTGGCHCPAKVCTPFATLAASRGRRPEPARGRLFSQTAPANAPMRARERARSGGAGRGGLFNPPPKVSAGSPLPQSRRKRFGRGESPAGMGRSAVCPGMPGQCAQETGEAMPADGRAGGRPPFISRISSGFSNIWRPRFPPWQFSEACPDSSGTWRLRFPLPRLSNARWNRS